MDLDLKLRLKAAYRQLLRPLVRILIRNGIEANEFTELAKLVYVDVARASILREGREAQNKELASVTGLPEHEIEKITNRSASETGEDSNLGLITKVLSGWHTDTEYTGPYGLPLELTFDDPRSPSFAALCARYAPAANPKQLLSELIRISAVKETDDNWFKVLTRTYLPKFDDPASLEHLGQSIENFANTIDHNRAHNDPESKLFERVVEADDGIRPEDLPRFKQFVRDRAQLLLEEIDNWLSQLDTPKENNDKAVVNTGLGIYHYVEKKD
ncbi:MAG: hypothetical protein JSV45_03425 [Chromatiales bacterium]|nr:MAG: hypothetical protein JSV45_03425 [Chromatiales bacterium]